MAKKKTVYERIEDRSETLGRVEAGEIEDALGAQPIASGGIGGSPFSVWALRSRLLSEVVSTGGRPARREAASRKKIPMTEAEWTALDQITKLLKHQGIHATAGQVAGVLLHQSLTEVLRQLDRVTPSAQTDAALPKGLTDADLERTLESVLAAAASAKVHLEALRPVAAELLRRMRDGKGAEGDEK